MKATLRVASSALGFTVLAACGQDAGSGSEPSLLHTVERGDVVITVRERGEVKAARDTRISSELEGRATLIYLISEGTVVAAGDKVAELDVSGIVEKRALQAINVAKAEAGLEQARKSVEIVEKELEAAGRTAETRFEIARLRLEKFVGQEHGRAPARVAGSQPAAPSTGTNAEMIARLRSLIVEDAATSASGAQGQQLLDRVLEILGPPANLELEMGELANQILQQLDRISFARADLNLADQTLYYSRKLAAKGFITTTELERDQIAYDRQVSAQAVAWNDLLLLVNYTLREDLLSLKVEVENSELNLESVRAANEARRVREDAELKSIEAEFGLALEQLANWDRQIENGVLLAPAPGLVVYGRFDWDEPVYEGMEVRERQEVILLPDISTMMIEIRVPEAQIGRLAVGQRATIQVDAFPSRTLSGVVTQVSSLPEPRPRSQTLRNYITKVVIDGTNADGALRPGMNGTVTVDVGTLADVLCVPITAIERKGETHFVWRSTASGAVPAAVELGGNNLTHVEVVAGLSEGDRIYLVRPPGARLPELPATEPATEPVAEPARTATGPQGATPVDVVRGSQ